MSRKNIILICGGDGSEHDISILSANYIQQVLSKSDLYSVTRILLHSHAFTTDDGKEVYFAGQTLKSSDKSIDIEVDCVIPCLHGTPGETGDIQAFLEILNIPYVGCKKESSLNCFNKVTTKLYLDAYGINNTPYIIIPKNNQFYQSSALAFFDKCQDVYVKAASQGSSIGCYHVKDRDDLIDCMVEAFMFSDSLVIEKTIDHRELEVATYELNGELKVTKPGEVIIPENVFYTFDEKYSKSSQTVTTVDPVLDTLVIEKIQDMARETFIKMNLRHLSRVDFFLSSDNEIIINEINTFPGMTEISLFPKLLAHNGDNMLEFLEYIVNDAIQNR